MLNNCVQPIDKMCIDYTKKANVKIFCEYVYKFLIKPAIYKQCKSLSNKDLHAYYTFAYSLLLLLLNLYIYYNKY
jgi:hypothetical protein